MWPLRTGRRFRFESEWKELMVVTGPGGVFRLDFPMGIPTAVLPSAERWAEVAPDWARGLWQELHDELADWCRTSEVILEIDPGAGVY